MSAIPGLKKKLRSVRTTGKLAKAMKTVSAAKLSRLSARWRNYEQYIDQYRFLYSDDSAEQADATVLMGSNRGFCGAFNNDILHFYRQNVQEPGHLLVCGSELCRIMADEGIAASDTFVFDDVPGMENCAALLERLEELANGTPFRVRLVYPRYINTMSQVPFSEYVVLNRSAGDVPAVNEPLYLPDRDSVLEELLKKGSRALIYGAVLSTAMGAQAATLMTMRSAYDTAAEYSEALAGQIQRLRQSEVTSDVIETSSERSAKGENTNG